jgi:hypothetical protein
MNAIQRARWRRRERAAKRAWEPPPVDAARTMEWLTQKAVAEKRMAEFDEAVEVVGIPAWYARLSQTEKAFGPLLTDEWTLAPKMQGIGPRLGSLNQGEMEAEQ